VDYMINNRNSISLSTMLMAGQFKTSDVQDYHVKDNIEIERLNGLRLNDQHAQFQNKNLQLLYKKTFPKAGKELTADLNGNMNNSDNGYLFTTHTFFNPDTMALPVTYQKNVGKTDAYQGVFQLDFTNPLSETKKLEAGVKAYYKESTSTNNTTRANSTNDIYYTDSIMSNHYLIKDMINAAYVNYNDKTIWNISYQAGLRFEHSYYKGTIIDKKQSFSYNYPNKPDDILKSLFPGIYLSKKFEGGSEWQLNFSRKIQRPNFFQMMPFVMFADRQNYRIGNPELRPEFRNIGELNYNKTFTKGSYLGSVYVRLEEQPITEVAYPSLDDPEVLVYTTVNGKNSIQYGLEHTFKYTWFKNLDATFNINAFYINITGIADPSQPEITAKGFAANSKINVSYRFPKQLTLQINGQYQTPKILLLGNTIPVYSMDISVNKMIGTKWVLNASLNDVFNSRRMGTHYETPFYIQDLSRRREARYVRFTVTYMFGKMDASIFKRAKQNRNTNDNQGNQDGLDFGK
jgi:Outer membrane protein beta-barrel family